MRNAETILNIIRDRGQRGLPIERIYRLLYNRELYLKAYSKIYANDGSMTKGATNETVDGMTVAKIDAIIEALRFERYRWIPVRRIYIPKKNGKQRPLGLPTWSNKLLQEVIRMLLEAYYEPQFSDHSHGFRQERGCHTALAEISRKWHGIKWFIEGDISSCFDKIDHTIVLNILRHNIHDNRFIRLIGNLLTAGYLEQWQYNKTHSGVPQGGVVSPILSNIVLNQLDHFVEKTLIPAYTRGRRRKTYPPYVALTKAASSARQAGDLEAAKRFNQQAQAMPSRDPTDPNFRRLRYKRYADDFLLGFIGTKAEATEIKQRLKAFLQGELKLQLSDDKTEITHARTDYAHYLGYKVETLHADHKHDYRGQRCINGAIGFRVPDEVISDWCRKYLRHGKPIHLAQRVNDSAFSIVAQYQAEYVGIVQYYQLAYNLHRFSKLKRVMEESLTKTLANKFNTTRKKIYHRYKTLHRNEHGIYKVIEVPAYGRGDQKTLVARFGGVPLRWNKWVKVNDTHTEPIWSGRSELLERLLANKGELCGSEPSIEVHHLRKLADLGRTSQGDKPRWVKTMQRRHRKTLIVCQKCHHNIHYGRYDGKVISK